MSSHSTQTGSPVRSDVSLLTAEDLYLFNEGSHYRIHEKMGAHVVETGSERGTCFSVWAPNASEVYVIGSFNSWDHHSHPLQAKGGSGIWEGFIPGVGKGTLYKFHIVSQHHGHVADKADPFGCSMRNRPARRQLFGIWIISGATGTGWKAGEDGTRCMLPCPSTKFTSVPGCGFRRSTTGR